MTSPWPEFFEKIKLGMKSFRSISSDQLHSFVAQEMFDERWVRLIEMCASSPSLYFAPVLEQLFVPPESCEMPKQLQMAISCAGRVTARRLFPDKHSDVVRKRICSMCKGTEGEVNCLRARPASPVWVIWRRDMALRYCRRSPQRKGTWTGDLIGFGIVRMDRGMSGRVFGHA